MLKVIANFYADNQENLKEVADTLESAGYSIAYSSELSAIAIKEVEDPEE